MIRDFFLLLLGIAIGAVLFVAYPAGAEQKSFDERKWERIEKNRELRRVKEARFESCARSCLERCK